MREQAKESRGLQVALAGYVVLLVLQLVAYFVTHIVVLLATAFEVLSSMLVAALLLVAASRSRKPSDKIHMFGYGRIQNVASLVVATMFITFMSVEVFRQAIPKFFQTPEASTFQNTDLAFVVTLVSIFVPARILFDLVLGAAKTTVKDLKLNEFTASDLYHLAVDQHSDLNLKSNSWSAHVVSSAPNHPSYGHYTARRRYFRYLGKGKYSLDPSFLPEGDGNTG